MLTLVEAPAAIVTLPEAKKHLQIVHDRDDTLIEAQIASATAFLDGPYGYLASCIGPQKWRWQTGAFTDPLRLPIGPIISIDAISYRSVAGDPTAMDLAGVYVFGDAVSPYLRPVTAWPADVAQRDDAITIEVTAGRTVTPAPLKSAVLLIVGQLYRHREIDVDVRNFPTSFGAMDLARPFRMVM